jgi:hypothetical protein
VCDPVATDFLDALLVVVLFPASALSHHAAPAQGVTQRRAWRLTPLSGERIFNFIVCGDWLPLLRGDVTSRGAASSGLLHEHRDEAPVIRNGWLLVAADMRLIETA